MSKIKSELDSEYSSEVVLEGDYHKSLTDVSKLTLVAFINIGAKEDAKYLDPQFRTGETAMKDGRTVRNMMDVGLIEPPFTLSNEPRCATFTIPISRGERNLIRVQMYRGESRTMWSLSDHWKANMILLFVPQRIFHGLINIGR